MRCNVLPSHVEWPGQNSCAEFSSPLISVHRCDSSLFGSRFGFSFADRRGTQAITQTIRQAIIHLAIFVRFVDRWRFETLFQDTIRVISLPRSSSTRLENFRFVDSDMALLEIILSSPVQRFKKNNTVSSFRKGTRLRIAQGIGMNSCITSIFIFLSSDSVLQHRADAGMSAENCKNAHSAVHYFYMGRKQRESPSRSWTLSLDANCTVHYLDDKYSVPERRRDEHRLADTAERPGPYSAKRSAQAARRRERRGETTLPSNCHRQKGRAGNVENRRELRAITVDGWTPPRGWWTNGGAA